MPVKRRSEQTALVAPPATPAAGARETSPRRTSRGALPEMYQLVVDCRDERQLELLFEQLVADGHTCRVIML